MDTSTTGNLQLTGAVHGGQQAVTGARIFLYTVGQTGNSSAATDLLAASGHTVYSGQYGSFSITGDYSCPAYGAQVYIVATGGNPGIGSNNNAITLVAALGSCGTLLANASTTFITINEVTTAAAAWALAGFATSPTKIGASSSNGLGMFNAMGHAALLANTTTGAAAVTTGQTIESGKLYALADALATCVNSNGSGCNGLFTAATPPGGTAPTDTFTAALNIVHYPGNNVAAVYNQIGTTPPFTTTLSSAPNDWTMSDTIAMPKTGGNTASPQQLALDVNGAAWTVDSTNSLLFAVGTQGALLSTSGYGSGVLSDPLGVTVDYAGNVWTSSNGSGSTVNSNAGYLNRFTSTSSTAGSAGTLYSSASGHSSTGAANGPYFYDSNTLGPHFLFADSPGTTASTQSGNIAYTSYAGGSYTEVWTDTGTVVASTQDGDAPLDAVFTNNHGLWLPSGFNQNGVYRETLNNTALTGTFVSCCSGDGTSGIGVDPAGNVWVNGNNGSNTISEILSTTNAVSPSVNAVTTDNISTQCVTGDAGGVMWFANQSNSSIAAISSGTGSSGMVGAQAAGTSISPANGFGRDAGLSIPVWIAPDASGDLWLTDSGNGDVVLFFGLATPTSTPQLALPTAP